MSIDLKQETSPINPDDEKYARMLMNIQGNILKPHGRNYAIHLFLHFTGDASNIRQWISDFTTRYVTSAYRQRFEAKEYSLNNTLGHLFGGFYLTAQGYHYLQLDHTKFQEETSQGRFKEVFFKSGMKAARDVLSDPPVEEWQAEYRNETHALLILADDNLDRLTDVYHRTEQSLAGKATVAAVERGFTLRDMEEHPYEHFGYRDGISQPLYYREDVEKELAKIPGDEIKWNPGAGLEIILVNDPLVEKEDCFGSYLVFRKLEQNVLAFSNAIDNLADQLGFQDEAKRELSGAWLVGRFKNGTPVNLSDKANGVASDKYNNFTYGTDLAGNKCPFHAHIRKVNPRGDTEFTYPGKIPARELRHRITRRGITYGHREIDPETKLPKDLPEKDVGLLFMCFQSSIPMQFGFLQAQWSNNRAFPQIQSGIKGLDPIIGQELSLTPNRLRFNPVWGRTDLNYGIECDFAKFVNFKGGEFFFAPSIPFLQSLTDADRRDVANI
jgi:Dyp-type peroxidase family